MTLDYRSNKAITLPSKDDLIKIKETVTIPEVGNYLLHHFEERLVAANKFEEGKPAYDNIRDFVDLLEMQSKNRGDPWAGIPGPLNDFQNLQQNRAEKAAEKAGPNIENTLFVEFALSDKGQMVRAFATLKQDLETGKLKKKALDPETRQELDKMVQAVLAEANLISKGSVIYEGDENGQIRRDAKGEPVLADVEKAKQVLNNASKQLEKYFKQSGKDAIHVETKERAFPKQPAISKTQAPETAPGAKPEAAPESGNTSPQASGPSSS
ncbi:hypothetical protein [Legionella clemsonensis]|uniref:Substrate of the Dot/Icm secretion system n=1 Tax=Legionella clemsonensis TaxID=1867846 RepID=A0A222P5X9_9GAMM|nr:hypothetical protein [Legionella clemsonensis]ASQ47248.1 hypothetical protein clem_13605 [Legionella clemsonensis]